MKLRIKSAREKCVLLLAVWRMGVEMRFTDMAVRLLSPAVEKERPECSLCFLPQLIAARRSVVLCFVMQQGREGQDMGCFPFCSEA